MFKFFLISVLFLLAPNWAPAALERLQIQEQGSATVIESLQNWRQDTMERTDLEDRERDLRQQFISRLLFQIERKYMGENLRQFFKDSIWDMCLTDRMKMNQSWGGMEVFLENLNQSLKELLEPRENPIGFIQAFTEFSGISDPATMEEFSETRSYTDGRQVQVAHPLELEQAADFAEEKDSLGDFQARLAEAQYNLKKDFELTNSALSLDPTEDPEPEADPGP